jgi:EAL domain-containing protein (putative c-di-GMP-specific phosphodiesterase class I)
MESSQPSEPGRPVLFELDELVLLAAALTEAPMVQVIIAEADRLRCYAQMGPADFELPRNSPFYAATVAAPDCLIVPDTRDDDRFAADELVTAGPRIRFYAGVVLRTRSGQVLGALCLFGGLPRTLNPQCHDALAIVARKLSETIEAQRAAGAGHRQDGVRQQMMRELRKAADNGDFELHYQPKVGMRSNRITGFEALLRWDSAVFGAISPTVFVPLLEESGLILPVGAWVIQQALADHRLLLERGLSVPSIAVNVSPAQLADGHFVGDLERALGGTDARRGPLDIEITEGMLLENTGLTIRRLNAIRNMGAHIAIDDFGTGYSSLRYLAHLPIDALKIDRSFVSMMADEADNMAIVSSVIALAHGLDLDVVAEGVETVEQRKLLGLLRCDEMQGFLFSPAVDRDGVADLLVAESNAATHRNRTLLIGGELDMGVEDRRRSNRTRR